MQVADVVLYLGPMVMVAFIVCFALMSRGFRNARRAEVQKAVIEKFASAQELTEFMKTPEGQEFMRDPAGRRRPWHQPLIPAIILFFIGGSMLFLPGLRTPGLLICAAASSLVVVALVLRAFQNSEE